MPGIDDRREAAAALQQRVSWSGVEVAPSDLEGLVDTITFNGDLAALLAYA